MTNSRHNSKCWQRMDWEVPSNILSTQTIILAWKTQSQPSKYGIFLIHTESETRDVHSHIAQLAEKAFSFKFDCFETPYLQLPPTFSNQMWWMSPQNKTEAERQRTPPSIINLCGAVLCCACVRLRPVTRMTASEVFRVHRTSPTSAFNQTTSVEAATSWGTHRPHSGSHAYGIKGDNCSIPANTTHIVTSPSIFLITGYLIKIMMLWKIE